MVSSGIKIIGNYSCPRCKGSMIREKDYYGGFNTCLACGYVEEKVPEDVLLEISSENKKTRNRQPSYQGIKL